MKESTSGGLLAAAGGLAGATALAFLLIMLKKRELESRIARARLEAMADGATRGELAEQAARLQEDLAAYARAQAELKANRIAEDYIGSRYGLTRDRILRIETLYRRYAA